MCFGNVAEDKTKIKILANAKHRESKKIKSKLLDITKFTTVEEYKAILTKTYSSIKSAIKKMKLEREVPVYRMFLEGQNLSPHLNAFDMNLSNVVEKLKELPEKEGRLCRFNLKEDTPCVAFTNIIFYDNENETLPLGMDESQKVLIDNTLLDVEIKATKTIKLAFCEGEKLTEPEIKTVIIEEYNII